MPTSARKTAETAEFQVDVGIDPYDYLCIVFLPVCFVTASFSVFGKEAKNQSGSLSSVMKYS